MLVIEGFFNKENLPQPEVNGAMGLGRAINVTFEGQWRCVRENGEAQCDLRRALLP